MFCDQDGEMDGILLLSFELFYVTIGKHVINHILNDIKITLIKKLMRRVFY